MSNTLRSKIIRLAHQHPEFREHLLPLVKKAAAPVLVNWKKGVAIFKSPGIGTLMVKPDRWLPNGDPSVYGNSFLSSILAGVWREWSGENQAEDDPMSDFVGFQPEALVQHTKPVALHLDNQEWQALMDRAQSTGTLHLAKGQK